MSQAYKTTKWGKHTNYECASCPFATLEKGVIENHVRQAHGAEPAPEPAPAANKGDTK